MNKEVIKAMHKKPTSRVSLWWHKARPKICRFLLFPLLTIINVYDKVKKYLYDKNPWDETRANEILNRYIPRCADWNEDEQTFYFFDNGRGWVWDLAKRYVKRHDRRFWNRHTAFFGGQMRQYLLNKFELDGFTKEVHDTGNYDWTEITFTLKKED